LIGAQIIIVISLPIKYYIVEVKRNSSQTPTSNQSRWESMKKHFKTSWIRAAVIILLFCYSNMTINTFNVLFCERLFGQKVLIVDANQPCFDAYHTPAFVIGILLLIFYILALPIGLGLLLFRFKKLNLLKEESTSKAFGYIYDSFEEESFFAGVFWVVILFSQGLSFALNPFGLASILISILSFGLFLIFLVIRRPFKRHVLNYLTILIILFVILVQIFAYVHLSDTAFFVTGVIFFAICMAIVVPLVFVPLAVYAHNMYLHKYKSGRESTSQSVAGSSNSLMITDMKLGGGFQQKSSSKTASVELSLLQKN